MPTVSELQATLFDSCKAALRDSKNKKSRFSNLSGEELAQFDEKVKTFSDLCRYSGKQTGTWSNTYGQTNTLYSLLEAFKNYVESLADDTLQLVDGIEESSNDLALPQDGTGLSALTIEKLKPEVPKTLNADQVALLSSYGFVNFTEATLCHVNDKISYYYLLEIGIYNYVDVMNNTPVTLEQRKNNLIHAYHRDQQEPGNIFARSTPEILGALVLTQPQVQNREDSHNSSDDLDLQSTQTHLYSHEQLYTVKFDIKRLTAPESIELYGELPVLSYFNPQYQVVSPARTWSDEEVKSKVALSEELATLKRDCETELDENVRVKLLAAVNRVENVLVDNKLLSSDIKKYFFAPLKIYHYLQINIKTKEIELAAFQRYEFNPREKSDLHVKRKLIENIKKYTDISLPDLLWVYQIAITSLGLRPMSGFDLIAYQEMMYSDNVKTVIKKNELAENVTISAVYTVWPEKVEKPSLESSARNIFFHALKNFSNVDQVMDVLIALNDSYNLLNLTQRTLGNSLHPLIGCVANANDDTVKVIVFNIFTEIQEPSSQIEFPFLEKSILSTFAQLRDSVFDLERYKADRVKHAFLLKLQLMILGKFPESRDILLSEDTHSFRMLFRVLGRSHKIDPAGRDGNTKRLHAALEFITTRFNEIPEAQQKLFGNKKAEQITHFDLLEFAVTCSDFSPILYPDTVLDTAIRNQNLIYFFSEERQAYEASPLDFWVHSTGYTANLINFGRGNLFSSLMTVNERGAVMSSAPTEKGFLDKILAACRFSRIQRFTTSMSDVLKSLRTDYTKMLEAPESKTIDSLMARIERDLADAKKRQHVIDLFAPLGLVDRDGVIVAYP
ncbi:MAG: hypothetical protein NTU49_03435, partial [Gammaproteobacteria bacterium]|nr:hypothetical protein [Gammaproteobacteria bacterium]